MTHGFACVLAKAQGVGDSIPLKGIYIPHTAGDGLGAVGPVGARLQSTQAVLQPTPPPANLLPDNGKTRIDLLSTGGVGCKVHKLPLGGRRLQSTQARCNLAPKTYKNKGSENEK